MISPVGKQNKANGFTLVIVLVAIVIVALLAERAIVFNSQRIKRDNEAELIYRGMAMQRAIASYYQAGNPKKYLPRSLDDLVMDPRFAHKRHLRTRYQDPITKGEWGILTGMDGGIAGVYSKSGDLPLKQGRFPATLAHFEGAVQYAHWHFEYKPTVISPPDPRTGLPTPVPTPK